MYTMIDAFIIIINIFTVFVLIESICLKYEKFCSFAFKIQLIEAAVFMSVWMTRFILSCWPGY